MIDVNCDRHEGLVQQIDDTLIGIDGRTARDSVVSDTA